MKERPIIFSGPMVRAISKKRKTQTRRVIKPRHHWHMDELDDGNPWPYYDDYVYGEAEPIEVLCPHGGPGDRLWVKETFCPRYFDDGSAAYRAEWSAVAAGYCSEPKWKPSIHMPRWASRITLEIKNVRVERVQDISPSDCLKEGLEPVSLYDLDCDAEYKKKDEFIALWNSIKEKRGYGWEKNPWVWVIEFEMI